MTGQSKTPDYTDEIHALQEAIKQRRTDPAELAFVIGTVVEEMRRLNGEALSLESQIASLTKRREALEPKLQTVRHLAEKFGLKPPLPTTITPV